MGNLIAIYIKVGQLKLLQGSKVVVVSLQTGVHVFTPHHLRDGEHHLVDTQARQHVQGRILRIKGRTANAYCACECV